MRKSTRGWTCAFFFWRSSRNARCSLLLRGCNWLTLFPFIYSPHPRKPGSGCKSVLFGLQGSLLGFPVIAAGTGAVGKISQDGSRATALDRCCSSLSFHPLNHRGLCLSGRAKRTLGGCEPGMLFSISGSWSEAGKRFGFALRARQDLYLAWPVQKPHPACQSQG